MNEKLLILHTDGVITAAVIIPVIHSAVQMTLVDVDPTKDHAYRTVNAGKSVSRRIYEEAVGIFAKRLVIIDPYGNANQHPADSLLLTIAKHAAARAGGETRTLDLPDILAHAAAGKYVVKEKKLERNPAWQEPMITVPNPDPV